MPSLQRGICIKNIGINVEQKFRSILMQIYFYICMYVLEVCKQSYTAIWIYIQERFFKFWYNASSSLIVDMFRLSGTPQYNPKFPKIVIKIERIRIHDIESRIQNTTIPMYVFIRIYTVICMYIYAYTQLYVCIYTHIHSYIYVYIRIYTACPRCSITYWCIGIQLFSCRTNWKDPARLVARLVF